MACKDGVVNGLASIVGTITCLVIAVELYEDLTERATHFRLPRIVKIAALCGFAFWAVLEAHKVQHRVDYLLQCQGCLSS